MQQLEDKMKIAIVQAQWNAEITDILANSCEDTLKKENVNIIKFNVAGAVELPVMAKNIIMYDENVDAVICIGAVIKGGTDHDKYVASQAAYGCQKVAIDTSVPVVFGVLTVPNKELALQRANGEHSYSGIEWANAAIQIVKNIQQLQEDVI
ncbi:MAG: 6,7-dimethyl-8-ribityllumazine synthase [Alphaproteobacteria bacterium]|jgi:6,7-dimethyl-8-ribityllumazine synthase|nr:6,7-dimethyl-8-ribityllumazine synthase [Alphaproteobacteria bacterium]